MTVFLTASTLTLASALTYAYRQRHSILAWFGPPSVTMREVYADRPDGPTFDHSGFDGLLHRYVDKDGWVDYAGLARSPVELDKYIDEFGEARFSEMGRDEKLALLINAYNAMTLRLVLDHYPLDSIRDIPSAKRWDDERWRIGGRVTSLNEIEHEEIRAKFREPRIHLALVCAAVGCPPLRQEAYVAERLDEQLAAQTRYVLSHDRWHQFDRSSPVLRLTQLFNWYGGDFEQTAGSVLSFVSQYVPAVGERLAGGAKLTIRWLDYDWSLNDQRRLAD